MPPDDHHNPQVVRFQRLRGRIFVQARLHLLNAVYEAITHRVFGKTSPLQFDAQYWDSLVSLSASSFSQSQSHLSGSSLPPSSTPFQLAPYAAVVAALPVSNYNLLPARILELALLPL